MTAIVLLNYCNYVDTAACLDSLRAVSGPPFFVIVVDNCSPDGSGEKLRGLSEEEGFVFLAAEANNGFAAGNNLGIRCALERGADVIVLLNNDTLVMPGFLEELLRPFRLNPDAGAVTGRIMYAASPADTIWYAGGSVSRWTARTRHFGFGEKDGGGSSAAVPVTFASGCLMALSRRAIEQTGLLDEDYFLYEEDTDYCLRLAEQGFLILYAPDCLIRHKVSATVRGTGSAGEIYQVRNKYLLIQKRFPPLRRPLAWGFCTGQFLKRCLKRELSWKAFFMGLRAGLSGCRGKELK